MTVPDPGAAWRRVPRPVVTRFAPSPTGYLHLGHVVNAIYVWGMARALDGRVIIRVEDHDRTRSRQVFEAAMFEDLRWLGFTEPSAGETTFTRQSDRTSAYEDALGALRATYQVYACDCSRTRIGPGPYLGYCRERNLAESPGTGLRVRISSGTERFEDLLMGPFEDEPRLQCGDLLVRDRDGHWTYQFAVVVDDLLQGVSLVVRGADLLSSTARQIRLTRMLRRAWPLAGGRQTGEVAYLHHPLIHDSEGRKLSKSEGATGVRSLRQAGVSPAEVIGRAAAAVGLVAAPVPLEAAAVMRTFVGGGQDTRHQ